MNELQSKAFDLVLNSREKIITMTGAAGTGKTYTTAQIIQSYRGSIAITATTNKAAEVLSKMSERSALTVHKHFGFTLVQRGFDNVLMKVREHQPAKLVIVEEISLLPYSVWIEIHRLVKEGEIDKILLLGDPIQLPAIGKGIDIDALPGIQIELTEQMRQSDDPILDAYMKRLRSCIEQGTEFDFQDQVPDSIVFIDSHREFAKYYTDSSVNKKILAFRNKVVDTYNKHINGGNAFNIGDDVILDKPLASATNQDIVTVLDLQETDKFYRLRVVNHYGEVRTVLNYKSKSVMDDDLRSFQDVGDEEGYWELAKQCYRLKHAYTSSIHKSQGSTYDEVFLDGRDLISALNAPSNKWSKPISYDMFLRLFYVGISRMKSKSYVFIGDTRYYEKFKG